MERIEPKRLDISELEGRVPSDVKQVDPNLFIKGDPFGGKPDLVKQLKNQEMGLPPEVKHSNLQDAVSLGVKDVKRYSEDDLVAMGRIQKADIKKSIDIPVAPAESVEKQVALKTFKGNVPGRGDVYIHASDKKEAAAILRRAIDNFKTNSPSKGVTSASVSDVEEKKVGSHPPRVPAPDMPRELKGSLDKAIDRMNAIPVRREAPAKTQRVKAKAIDPDTGREVEYEKVGGNWERIRKSAPKEKAAAKIEKAVLQLQKSFSPMDDVETVSLFGSIVAIHPLMKSEENRPPADWIKRTKDRLAACKEYQDLSDKDVTDMALKIWFGARKWDGEDREKGEYQEEPIAKAEDDDGDLPEIQIVRVPAPPGTVERIRRELDDAKKYGIKINHSNERGEKIKKIAPLAAAAIGGLAAGAMQNMRKSVGERVLKMIKGNDKDYVDIDPDVLGQKILDVLNEMANEGGKEETKKSLDSFLKAVAEPVSNEEIIERKDPEDFGGESQVQPSGSHANTKTLKPSVKNVSN